MERRHLPCGGIETSAPLHAPEKAAEARMWRRRGTGDESIGEYTPGLSRSGHRRSSPRCRAQPPEQHTFRVR